MSKSTRMTINNCVSFAVVLTSLWTLIRGDTEVSCVYKESCILPCSFQTNETVVIHWIQAAGDTPVHSYYYNQDQLDHQDRHFRGRTSLFKDQISRGNASLHLTGVKSQDQGRYTCFTSTISRNKNSTVDLKVEGSPRYIAAIVCAVSGSFFTLVVFICYYRKCKE
uniref:Ig-like domain-containing protein n=1 Tax=Anabas testudineus TaxID=64144 RepID=A0AAQ6IGG9_ANATE